jgi:hypothetical protein
VSDYANIVSRPRRVELRASYPGNLRVRQESGVGQLLRRSIYMRRWKMPCESPNGSTSAYARTNRVQIGVTDDRPPQRRDLVGVHGNVGFLACLRNSSNGQLMAFSRIKGVPTSSWERLDAEAARPDRCQGDAARHIRDFPLAEVAITRNLFGAILERIALLVMPPPVVCRIYA